MNDGKVVVGYLHPADVATSFHLSLISLLVYDLQHEARILDGGGHLATFCGAGRIADGRNMLAARFLDTQDAEWLFMVDADMGFMPDTVDRLIAAADPTERPVVGGLCFAQKVIGMDAWSTPIVETHPTLYRFATNGTETGFVVDHDYPADTLAAYDLTGAACLLIHRSVLEQMRVDVGDNWFTPIGLDGALSGEDVAFCIRLRQMGVQLHVHTGIETTHQKHAYLRRQTTPGSVPTFVVVPGRDRHDMTYALLDQVAPQAEQVFLFDNGSSPPYLADATHSEVTCIDASDMALHRMWNDGLERAAKAAADLGVREWNVAVLNNDLEVPSDFLTLLAVGLRSRPNIGLAYPNWHGVPLARGQVVQTSGSGGRTMSGWAFMLRGEDGYRFDEQFEWWFGDDDMQMQVEAAGRGVVCVGVEHVHLEPNRSTELDPWLQSMTRRDRRRFDEKWPHIADARAKAKHRAPKP